MKALIRKRTTRTALNRPTSAPKPRTISRASQVSSWSPSGEPREAVSQAASMAANAITLSIDRSMWPAMMQNDRPTASSPTKVACCRMLMKMPTWKKCSIVTEQTRRIAARIAPDQMVEHEDAAAAAHVGAAPASARAAKP